MKRILSITGVVALVFTTSTVFSQDISTQRIVKKEAAVKLKSVDKKEISIQPKAEVKNTSLKKSKLKKVSAKPIIEQSQIKHAQEVKPVNNASIRSKKLAKFKLNEKVKAKEPDQIQKK